MYMVFLNFSENRSEAPRLLDAHKTWLGQGFDDGVFLMAGSREPGRGGAILARGLTREELDARLSEDPFVAEGVVRTEVHEIEPSRLDPRFA